MNGAAGSASPDGNAKQSDTSSQILEALEVIHDPRSPNLARQTASQYLEEVKSADEAPYHGFTLASAKSQPAIVRHYGLSLLEHAIRHRWTDYTSEQSMALRNWVLSLAQGVDDEDLIYIRNKVAAIWVEIAKRSWVLDWMDMDELLVRLWEGPVAQKLLVLTVLESLSEDIFGHEDLTAGLRGTDLNRACVEIFTPANVLAEHFPKRETSVNVRFGEEGWLSRIGHLVEWISNEPSVEAFRQICAVKALSTLKSIMGWVIPRALVTTRCVQYVCECLAASNIPIQLAAVDALYTLYNRSRFSEDDFRDLVCPMYQQDIVSLLKKLYEWSIVDPADIDEEKYLLSKKFSEMVFNIGRLLEERPSFIPENSDLSNFSQLLLSIVKSQSLHVSIPALHLWVKLLDSERIRSSPAVTALIPDLLETCSHRLIRYEALPEDSSNPSIMFLNEDVDTTPERHAFLGNYTRFCNQVVETIVQVQPADALYHILGQADQVLDHLYDGEPSFSVPAYTKTSVPLLRLDAQFSVIEAALKGYSKWLSHKSSSAAENEHEIMTSNLQVWCDRLLSLVFEDPLIKERVIQLAVGFATGPLKRNAQFAFRIFEYTLDTRCPDDSTHVAYSDAVKDLHGFCLHQLQRLAMRFPDYFITIFEEVERKVNQVSQEVALDEQTRVRYSSVLFIITHRATSVDPKPREVRLERFLEPIVVQWQREELTNSLSSFDGFCDLLGLGGIQQYVISRGMHQIQDWSIHPLDDEGRALQLHMQASLECLPLRATKTILSVSVEKLEPGSRTYNMACALWQRNIPLILPNLLHFISQAHAFHNPDNWAQMPPEMKDIVRRVLTDRFWQVGISTGSRDEFYAKVGGTRTTVEGFASSIRATLRAVREIGYRLLYYMSLLGEHFYSYEELPLPLARALFTDACALSTHQMAILVEMIRPVVDQCPIACRNHFLPPILAALFEQLDRKASSEWDRIETRTRAASEDDNLADEMRDESILRQLTFTSVMMVVGLLDPQKAGTEVVAEGLLDPHSEVPQSQPTIRSFILSTPEILKPVVLFCTHALRMRDTRSCSFITRVLRSLIPEFVGTDPIEIDVREFISTEVLKACITSLHDPYFVDLQKDLAQLIASIVIAYNPWTETPKHILLSLPSMSAEAVDRAIRHLARSHSNGRQQRAIVLDLLEGLRGVSVSEQGKIAKPDPKRIRSAMQEKYMTVDMETNRKKEESPDLAGIANMFG